MENLRNNPDKYLYDAHKEHYAPLLDCKTLDEAKHPYELVPEEGIVLHIDMAQHGLGTGSCGPGTLPEYSLYHEPFEFGVIFKPI